MKALDTSTIRQTSPSICAGQERPIGFPAGWGQHHRSYFDPTLRAWAGGALRDSRETMATSRASTRSAMRLSPAPTPNSGPRTGCAFERRVDMALAAMWVQLAMRQIDLIYKTLGLLGGAALRLCRQRLYGRLFRRHRSRSEPEVRTSIRPMSRGMGSATSASRPPPPTIGLTGSRRLAVGYQRLAHNAADSPVVEVAGSPNDFSGSVTISYAFGWKIGR